MEKTDAELMAQVAHGNGEMLGLLYRRHGRSVGVALRRWYPQMPLSDAEDLVQDVFIELGKSASRYEERAKFRAWLFKIAYRRAQDFCRRQGRSGMVSMDDAAENALSGMHGNSNQDARAEMRQVLRQMMSELPGELQQVLWLKVVEGFVSKEIAEITGVQENTVRTRLHRARGLLISSADAVTWRKALQGGLK